MGSPRGHQPFLHRHLPGWKAAARPQEVCRPEDRRHSESLSTLPSAAHLTDECFIHPVGREEVWLAVFTGTFLLFWVMKTSSGVLRS